MRSIDRESKREKERELKLCGKTGDTSNLRELARKW